MTGIATVKLFAGLPDKELKDIEATLSRVTQPAGKEIMISGRHGVGFMVILEGEAELSLSRGRSRRLGPGDHFGEIALLDDQGRSGTVVALTDMTLRCVVQWKFKAFLAKHPEVAWRILQSLVGYLREAERTV